MKKVFSMILCLLLVVSLASPAFAASHLPAPQDATVNYNSRRHEFTFGPGSRYSATDLFPNFKNVMPGDEVSQTITVSHKFGTSVNARIYVRAKGSVENKALLDQLKLTVEYKKDTIMYKAPDQEQASYGISEWANLGTFRPGASQKMTVTLHVPIELGNEFADEMGKLQWEFMVEEIPIDTTNPKTGDLPYVMMCGGVLVVSGAALCCLLFFALRKKKRQ